jgi:hypothetical protein
MTFAAAGLGIIAAAIAVPTLLILYFLKLRRRDLEVSTTLLWKKAIQDMQANAPFQRLRRNILLLLQLLMLAAAIMALAQPERTTNTAVGQRHVILIDRSASMQTADAGKKGSEKRLDEAKRQALELVNSLREPGLLDLGDESAGDQAMVVAFGVQADVRQNFTPNKAELRRAIEGIEPTDGPGLIEEAFKLAKAYAPKALVENKGFVALGPPAVIHIFSDGRLPDADKATPDPDDQVVFHAVGETGTENVAITGLRVERPFDDPGKLSLFVGVQSTFRTARQLSVELSIDGQVVAAKGIEIDPARPREAAVEAGADAGAAKPVTSVLPGLSGVVFALERAEGGVASLRLVSGESDALAVDDRAFVVIPPARRLSALLVTDGAFYLREALQGLNLTKLGVISPQVMQQMLDRGGESVDPNIGPLAQYDVIVLDKWLPTTPTPEGGTVQTLPPGRVLALGVVPPPPAGLIDEGEGGISQVLSYVRDHPALRYSQLEEITIGKSRKTRVADDTAVKIVARDQDSPIIFEAADTDTRALVLTFNPAESDWALKPGFIAFLASTLPWLAHSAGEESGTTLQPGQTLSQRLPNAGVGISDARLVLPDDQAVSLQPAADGTVAFGPLAKVGVYTLEWIGQAAGGDVEVEGRTRRALAANLLDAAESDVSAAPELALASRVVEAKDSQQNVTRKLWPWFVLWALGVCMLEWFVYNRKVHI